MTSATAKTLKIFQTEPVKVVQHFRGGYVAGFLKLSREAVHSLYTNEFVMGPM